MEADLPRLAVLDRESFPGNPYPYLVLRQLFDAQQANLLVAENGAVLCGCFLASSGPPTSPGWILSLCVARDFRGQGLGRALLLEGLRRLRAHEACEARLTVAPTNVPAMALYRSLGFTRLGSVRENYYGEGEDRFVMTLRL